MIQERELAYRVLCNVLLEGAYSNISLNKAEKKFPGSDMSLVRRLVYGVLENYFLLEHIMRNCLSKETKIKKKTSIIVKLGLYQLAFMDSIPDYAAVNETMKIAKKYVASSAGLVNALMRGYLRGENKEKYIVTDKGDMINYLSIVYSCHKSIVSMLVEQYGQDKAESLLKGFMVAPRVDVRVNLMRTSVEALKARLIDKGFSVETSQISQRTLHVSGKNLIDTEEYEDGLFSIQDAPSTYIVDELGCKAGETVIDLCAAPGGKTFAMAEDMGNKGRVIACDLYENRVSLIEKGISRMGLTNVETRVADGTAVMEEFVGTADRVLVDAPCSGIGVLGRKPEKKLLPLLDMSDLIGTQIKLLKAGSVYVKDSGILCYSTCTLNKNENEEVVETFLNSCEGVNFTLIKENTLMPNERGGDGFFIALLKKK